MFDAIGSALDFEEDTGEDILSKETNCIVSQLRKQPISRTQTIQESKIVEGNRSNVIEENEFTDITDIEEGEIRDSQSMKDLEKDTCRFYQEGKCAWGNSCRFLHLSDKGLYTMFDLPNLKGDHLAVENPLSCISLCNYGPQPLKVEETEWDLALKDAKERVKMLVPPKQSFRHEKLCMTLRKDVSVTSTKSLPKANRSCSPKSPIHKIQHYVMDRHMDYSKKCKENSQISSIKSKTIDHTYSSEWKDPWRRSRTPLKRNRQRLPRSTASGATISDSRSCSRSLSLKYCNKWNQNTSSKKSHHKKRRRSRSSNRIKYKRATRHRKRKRSYTSVSSSSDSSSSGPTSWIVSIRSACKRRARATINCPSAKVENRSPKKSKTYNGSSRKENTVSTKTIGCQVSPILENISPKKAKEFSLSPELEGQIIKTEYCLSPSIEGNLKTSKECSIIPPVDQNNTPDREKFFSIECSPSPVCLNKEKSSKIVPEMQFLDSIQQKRNYRRQSHTPVISPSTTSKADFPSPNKSCSDMSISPLSDSSLSDVIETSDIRLYGQRYDNTRFLLSSNSTIIRKSNRDFPIQNRSLHSTSLKIPMCGKMMHKMKEVTNFQIGKITSPKIVQKRQQTLGRGTDSRRNVSISSPVEEEDPMQIKNIQIGKITSPEIFQKRQQTLGRSTDYRRNVSISGSIVKNTPMQIKKRKNFNALELDLLKYRRPTASSVVKQQPNKKATAVTKMSKSKTSDIVHRNVEKKSSNSGIRASRKQETFSGQKLSKREILLKCLAEVNAAIERKKEVGN